MGIFKKILNSITNKKEKKRIEKEKIEQERLYQERMVQGRIIQEEIRQRKLKQEKIKYEEIRLEEIEQEILQLEIEGLEVVNSEFRENLIAKENLKENYMANWILDENSLNGDYKAYEFITCEKCGEHLYASNSNVIDNYDINDLDNEDTNYEDANYDFSFFGNGAVTCQFCGAVYENYCEYCKKICSELHCEFCGEETILRRKHEYDL